MRVKVNINQVLFPLFFPLLPPNLLFLSLLVGVGVATEIEDTKASSIIILGP